MSKMVDKFKNFMGFPDVEEDDFEENTTEENTEENEMDEDFIPSAISSRATSTNNNGNVLNISSGSNQKYQVVLVCPTSFNEVSVIADHLNAKRAVLLNLENVQKEGDSRRLVDFLSGVVYANNGDIKYASKNTYIIVPYNVSVVGELLVIDELIDNINNSDNLK